MKPSMMDRTEWTWEQVELGLGVRRPLNQALIDAYVLLIMIEAITKCGRV